MIFSRKNTLKMIDILEYILERVPTILCTFMETLIDVSYIALQWKKQQQET